MTRYAPLWRLFKRNRAATTVTEGADTSTVSLRDPRFVFEKGQPLRSSVTGNHWRVIDYLGAGGYGSVYFLNPAHSVA